MTIIGKKEFGCAGCHGVVVPKNVSSTACKSSTNQDFFVLSGRCPRCNRGVHKTSKTPFEDPKQAAAKKKAKPKAAPKKSPLKKSPAAKKRPIAFPKA